MINVNISRRRLIIFVNLCFLFFLTFMLGFFSGVDWITHIFVTHGIYKQTLPLTDVSIFGLKLFH